MLASLLTQGIPQPMSPGRWMGMAFYILDGTIILPFGEGASTVLLPFSYKRVVFQVPDAGKLQDAL